MAVELGCQFSHAQDRIAVLEGVAQTVSPTKVVAELGQARQQLTDAREGLWKEPERARDAEEVAAEARDELDQAQWRLEVSGRELEVSVARGKDEVRASMVRAHQRELETQGEHIRILRAQLAVRERLDEAMAASLRGKGIQLDRLREQLGVQERSSGVQCHEDESQHRTYQPEERLEEEGSQLEYPGDDETRRLEATEGTGQPTVATAQQQVGRNRIAETQTMAEAGGRSLPCRTKLPSLPYFGAGDKRNDDEAFDRWVRKLERYTELEQWDEWCKLVQFELHLSDRAERLYEVLPAEAKRKYTDAVGALRQWLHPVKQEALTSAQLMKRKQKPQETVDEYAQHFEHLFDQSYGQRSGMDRDSKTLLKRDLFVQGLLLKWQVKVLPSAKSFEDSLHQARSAEEQEKQLTEIHGSEAVKHQQRKQFQSSTFQQPKTQAWMPWQSSGSSPGTSSKGSSPITREERPSGERKWTRGGGQCFSCGSYRHKERECPQRKPPSEARGRQEQSRERRTLGNIRQATAEEGSGTTAKESLTDRCQRPQEELTEAEFQRMSTSLESRGAMIDTVTGSLGPLYYAQVNTAGTPVKAMVDSGSSATIMSFERFKAFGKSAGIRGEALSRPDITLRDYSQRVIPIGARVDLEFQWRDKKVTAPVYLYSDRSSREPCLLRTNVMCL